MIILEFHEILSSEQVLRMKKLTNLLNEKKMLL